MQSWSARWSTLFAYEDVNKQRREWLILGKIYKRDKHGSSEQSEFTTNNSGLTMSRGKNVILIIVYKRTVETEAKSFKLEIR